MFEPAIHARVSCRTIVREVENTERRDDSAMRDEREAMHAHLRIMTGLHAGAAFVATRDGLVVGRVGSDSQPDVATVALLDDRWISRRHARLHAQRGVWQILDLGGRNRAFVEGAPLATHAELTLADGALLRFGDTLIVFRVGLVQSDGICELDAFPGAAPSANVVRERLHQLARTTGHVLVLGETGTGKERVARALAAPQRPFVPQNCAELTRDFARSELFGHVRGAFSGAVAAKPGLVELAERGVLFLDEIGELALDVQAELLRFLEDGCYRPIGATDLRRSSVRVVAATNVDLDAAVRAGQFRRDLLSRLRASNPQLELPPLRARREDLPTWAQRFVAEASADAGPHRPLSFSPGAMECVLLYPWPGNLRELRGVVRGLVAAAPVDRTLAIQPEQLPTALRDHRRTLRSAAAPAVDAKLAVPLALTHDTVQAALALSGGSVRAAANKLGIDRRRLYRLCEKLGISLDRHRGNPEKEEDGDG